MDLNRIMTDLENYGLAVQDVENSATGLMAAINYLFELIDQEESFTRKQLLEMKEQCSITISQAALAKALEAIRQTVNLEDI